MRSAPGTVRSQASSNQRQPRHSGEQRLRVLRLRRAQHRLAVALLFNAPGTHDRDAVGDVLDDTDVVRDEDRERALAMAMAMY